MSRLYVTEKGHVVPTLCEELTTFRRSRKVLPLPATESPATLYVLARSYPGNDLPLRLAVNGNEVPPVPSGLTDGYRWYEVTVDPNLLEAGDNVFEFWTDATAMNAWSLAIEAGHAEPASFVSDDGGRSWRNSEMGYLNVLRGEYVARVRMAEGKDPDPPAVVWEDQTSPRLESLRQVIPAQALQSGSLLQRIRALTFWLSTSWEHTSSAVAAQYGPWDAETILAWGRTRSGHAGQLPIVMCVHYAVAFVSCCAAANIPARCSVLWGTLNEANGHFVGEVWFEDYGKWVMVDPNLDAILWQNGVPMSVTEIQQAGTDLAPFVEWGPGIEFQRQNPRLGNWVEDVFLSGLCFRHRSVWWRTDFLSHPELAPPGHGSTAYCETGLVWEKRDLQRGLGMFPYFAESDYFDVYPPART
jgi:hypothetical protein